MAQRECSPVAHRLLLRLAPFDLLHIWSWPGTFLFRARGRVPETFSALAATIKCKFNRQSTAWRDGEEALLSCHPGPSISVGQFTSSRACLSLGKDHPQ